MRLAVSFELVTGERFKATCRNVGLGGAFVETMDAAPFESRIVLFLPLPDLPLPSPIECVVRWTSSDGMGVQFAPMGAKETHALTQLIYGG